MENEMTEENNALEAKYPWQLAAEKMVAAACLAEYKKANTDKSGRKYAKHRQYTVPDWCQPLLDAALRDEDEVETKRIMHVVRAGCFTMV
jgi:hypothetical protein